MFFSPKKITTFSLIDVGHCNLLVFANLNSISYGNCGGRIAFLLNGNLEA